MRVGFLWPADGLNDAEFLIYLSENLTWHTARYDAGTETEELTVETLSAYADPAVLRNAARGLHAVSPDIVACGDHAAAFMAGASGERAMSQAVTDELKVPCVTMARATEQALEALGALKVALFSPYAADVSQSLVSSLEAAGLTIASQCIAGAESEEEIGTRPAETWLSTLRELVETAPERPDALLVAGGGLCFAAAIEALEAETGIPVVTAPGALVWAVGRALGIETAKPGLGRLFRPAPTNAVQSLSARQSTGTKTFAVTPVPPVFVSGAGAFLIDENGRSYLDFACGSGTTALGHGHPEITDALQSQIASGVTHLGPHFHAPVQAQLYDMLGELLPAHLNRLHPSVSGSEATEVALKAAMHATGRRRFLAFEGGYHGRTFGALSVSGARGKNEVLAPFAPQSEILPFPETPSSGQDAARAVTADLAGILIEPIQATAGFRQADTQGLAALAQAAMTHGVPLIVDEVFTGFGRTGRMFGFQHYDLEPDLVIMAKSFGGGQPTGLVAGRESLLGTWPPGTQTSTFQLHPMAAASALAFLRVLVRDDLIKRAQGIDDWCAEAFGSLANRPGVKALRGIGAFWVLEMESPERTQQVRRRALEAGLLTWECGEKGCGIGLVPPLIVEQRQIQRAAEILSNVLT